MSTIAISEPAPCVESVSELRDLIVSHASPAWKAKMLHAVPDWPTVPQRGRYLMVKAKGRVVFDVGCTGAIADGIRRAAKMAYGVDKAPGGPWDVVDLDREPERLPVHPDVEVVIVSEFIEHLSNPGRFLDALRAAYPTQDTYVTVPNAGGYQVRDGAEVVNGDHVAWYSYSTLTALLTRHGYRVELMRWYHGEPHRAEGIIMLARGAR